MKALLYFLFFMLLFAIIPGTGSNVFLSSLTDPTETVHTVHVSIQPGQSYDKEWAVSNIPDSVDVIRIVVTAQDCKMVRSL